MEEYAGWDIPSERGLWDLLAQLADDPELAAGIPRIQIRGWQPQLLYYPDETVAHSVRPTVARAVTDFHASLSRAYALLIYGEANRQLLRGEDKQILDFVFVATAGSSGLKVIEDTLNRFVDALSARLSGRQVIAVIVVFLVLYFTADSFKDFIASQIDLKRHELESDERIALSEQETARMELLIEAIAKFGVPRALQDEADDAKRALIRPSVHEDRSQILGVEIKRDQARAALSSEKSKRIGRRVDGIYSVVDINTESDDGYAVRLQNAETGEEFTAAANYGELTPDDIHTIFASAESKTNFRAQVNAFVVGDKIDRAFIVRADMIDQ